MDGAQIASAMIAPLTSWMNCGTLHYTTGQYAPLEHVAPGNHGDALPYCEDDPCPIRRSRPRPRQRRRPPRSLTRAGSARSPRCTARVGRRITRICDPASPPRVPMPRPNLPRLLTPVLEKSHGVPATGRDCSAPRIDADGPPYDPWRCRGRRRLPLERLYARFSRRLPGGAPTVIARWHTTTR